MGLLTKYITALIQIRMVFSYIDLGLIRQLSDFWTAHCTCEKSLKCSIKIFYKIKKKVSGNCSPLPHSDQPHHITVRIFRIKFVLICYARWKEMTYSAHYLIHNNSNNVRCFWPWKVDPSTRVGLDLTVFWWFYFAK